jgi:hypothetical protein
MKQKLIITCAAVLALLCDQRTSAQSWLLPPNAPAGEIRTDGSTNEVVIDGSTKLGINTTKPATAHLTINGEIDFQDNNPGWPTYRHIRAHNIEKGLAVLAKHGWEDGAGILLNGKQNNNGEGDITLSTNEGQSGNGGATYFNKWIGSGAGGYWQNNMTIDKDGNVNARGDFSLSGNVIRFNPHPSVPTTWNRYLFGNTESSLAIFSNNDQWQYSSGAVFNSSAHPTESGSVSFVATGSGTPTHPAFNFVVADANGNWQGRMHLNKGGDLSVVGDMTIGSDLLSYKTDASGSPVGWNRFIHANTKESFAIFAGHDWSSGAGLMLHANKKVNSNTVGGGISIVAGSGSEGIINFARWKSDNSGWIPSMIINQQGKVVIGDVPTNTPNYDYRLYVQNGILTERVKVALSSDPNNWSDFVFADDYKLRSLNEVEEFIKENKHLPEIPSTEDVHKEGLDLAQMDAKLLQKIEELMLYVIDQHKRLNVQQTEIESLTKKWEQNTQNNQP